MGSGKSTLGPILANVLGYDFEDLDALIEAQAGKPPAAVFAEAGEAAFRKMEAALLRESGEREQVVIALGGGALVSEENLRWTLAHGTVVYLRVEAAQLARRLWWSPNERPLLLGEDGTALSRKRLQARIEAMLRRREPFYRRAHVVVDAGALSIADAVDAVAKALQRHR